MTVVPPSRGPLGKINGFQLLKFLGKGTFGAVYQARREADGKIYAIKKVDTRKMTAKERAEAVLLCLGDATPPTASAASAATAGAAATSASPSRHPSRRKTSTA